jgi:hypothetical protein
VFGLFLLVFEDFVSSIGYAASYCRGNGLVVESMAELRKLSSNLISRVYSYQVGFNLIFLSFLFEYFYCNYILSTIHGLSINQMITSLDSKLYA